MMQHKELKGQKLKYRPMRESELSDTSRHLAYDAQTRALMARERNMSMIEEAGRKQPAFDRLARWVVATCKTGTEKQVSEALEALDIECWCPTERKQKPPRRGHKAVEIHVPIFRGYLFVRVIPSNRAYVGLLMAGKINGLMSSGGAVYLMPERLMERIMLLGKKRERKQVDANELPAYLKAVGTTVRVRSGPFSSFMVTLKSVLDKKGKFLVEVPLFGGMTEMTIDVDSIEL